MKYFKILAVLVFTSIISFYSCNDTAKAPNQETTKSVETSNVPAASNAATATPNQTTTNQATKEPAQNQRGVWHYTCGKGCAGGAGSAINCTNCGTTLAHNQAYHSKTNTTTTQSSAPFATPVATTNTTPKTPEPSQNKAGIWHYTCGKGCAGGAGSASACGTCGETLKHNKAYHQ